jgi:sigma-B regulation protein RsbU (phosphoserine phosphatase)
MYTLMPTTTMTDFPDSRAIDTPPAARQERLLVVDDDPANRESLARRLQRRGMVVDTAEDGAMALAAIEAAEAAGQPFALILLDVMMPGLSGLEVLARLRETRPATVLPVIMATANDTREDIVAALTAGANDYVTKPLDFPIVMARVQTQLELRRSVRQILELEERLTERNTELQRANDDLRRAAAQTRRDLELAAKVQATFLPRADAVESLPVDVAWCYDPCEHVAGDALNICPLDDDHVGFYVLDVSGHGVAAALTAVAAARLLAPAHDPDTILVDTADDGTRRIVPPAEVAARMTARFTFNSDTIQFLTCFYAVFDARSRRLTYACAGHPGPLVIRNDGEPRALDGSGMPIGIGESFEQHSIDLAPGDRLFLYTDGVSECRRADGELFGLERLTEVLRSGPPGESLDASLDRLRNSLAQWRSGAPSCDDVSLLAIACPR